MPRPIWSIASRSFPAIDLRWRNKVIGLEQRNDHVLLTIETPDGPYRLHAGFVVACDGARSSLRQMVGAEFAGQVFEDQFLIADVKMTAAFPTERWFWFDPPFHAGQVRAAAQAAGRHLAHRPAAASRCGSCRRKAPGKCAAADRAHARP